MKAQNRLALALNLLCSSCGPGFARLAHNPRATGDAALTASSRTQLLSAQSVVRGPVVRSPVVPWSGLFVSET
jgi:hypothetical protein